ncbi:MAG: hypothetical protein ACI8XZ_002311 [Gammaproteobacteria bacterium]|jgi:hypothetical protein
MVLAHRLLVVVHRQRKIPNDCLNRDWVSESGNVVPEKFAYAQAGCNDRLVSEIRVLFRNAFLQDIHTVELMFRAHRAANRLLHVRLLSSIVSRPSSIAARFLAVPVSLRAFVGMLRR